MKTKQMHQDEDWLVQLPHYFPERFHQPFDVQRANILTTIERLLRMGESDVTEVRRGDGTTSIIEAAALLAICHGVSDFIVLATPLRSDAHRMRSRLLNELRFNERLRRDFAHEMRGTWCGADRIVITSGRKIVVRSCRASMRGLILHREGQPSVRPRFIYDTDCETQHRRWATPYAVFQRSSDEARGKWRSDGVREKGTEARRHGGTKARRGSE